MGNLFQGKLQPNKVEVDKVAKFNSPTSEEDDTGKTTDESLAMSKESFGNKQGKSIDLPQVSYVK